MRESEYPSMDHGFPRRYSPDTPEEILYDHGKVLGSRVRIVDTGRTILRQPRLETTLYRQEFYGMGYIVRGPQGEFYGRYELPPDPSRIPPYAIVEREDKSMTIFQGMEGGGGGHHWGGRRRHSWGRGYWPYPAYPVYYEEPENLYVIVNPAGKGIAVVKGVPKGLPSNHTFRIATPSEAATGKPMSGLGQVDVWDQQLRLDVPMDKEHWGKEVF